MSRRDIKVYLRGHNGGQGTVPLSLDRHCAYDIKHYHFSSVVGLEVRIGHYHKVVATEAVMHIGIGLTIVHPLTIASITELVRTVHLQVNRDGPHVLPTVMEGMR